MDKETPKTLMKEILNKKMQFIFFTWLMILKVLWE